MCWYADFMHLPDLHLFSLDQSSYLKLQGRGQMICAWFASAPNKKYLAHATPTKVNSSLKQPPLFSFIFGDSYCPPKNNVCIVGHSSSNTNRALEVHFTFLPPVSTPVCWWVIIVKTFSKSCNWRGQLEEGTQSGQKSGETFLLEWAKKESSS